MQEPFETPLQCMERVLQRESAIEIKGPQAAFCSIQALTPEACFSRVSAGRTKGNLDAEQECRRAFQNGPSVAESGSFAKGIAPITRY